jgi:hypothetical protein
MRLISKIIGWSGFAWCWFNAAGFAGSAIGYWQPLAIYDEVMVVVFLAAGAAFFGVATD